MSTPPMPAGARGAGPARPAAAVAARALTFRYPASDRPALVDVDLEVAPGWACSVAGPSGSGRSTLLAVLAGIAPAATGGALRGQVTRRGDAAWVLADPYASFSGARGSVRAELAFGLECRGVERRAMARRVDAALAAFGLAHLADRDPHVLSGGEAARLAVACQAVVGPTTILVDEVDAQLDAAGGAAVHGALADHVAAGGALLWATARLDGLGTAPPALRDGDAVVLQSGRVAARGRATEVAAAARDHDWGIVPAGGPVAPDGPGGRARAERGGPAWPPGAPPRDVVPWPHEVDRVPDLAPSAADLEVVAVTCQPPGAPDPILDGVSLGVAAGEVVALRGPNGAGKTTLARAVAGLEPLQSGAVRLGGRALAAADAGPARGVALAMQRPERMLFSRTALDEVAVGLRWCGAARGAADDRARRALAACGLRRRATDHPHDLGPAERRWLALAAVVALDTPVVVLDEPTAGFDGRDLARFGALLRALAAAGRTVLWITHDAALSERLADRTVWLARGQVVAGAAAAAPAP